MRQMKCLIWALREDLDNILKQVPEERRTFLFSATMPKEVEEIAKHYVKEAKRVQIGIRNQGSDNVKHYYYLVHQKKPLSCFETYSRLLS
jgi:ATP-dependent RNA helicase DeaD